MKEFLIDVPVSIMIWNRPECQRKQFEVIKKARPSILFLFSDGGRNDAEWCLIRENRNLYDEGIDWDCKVYKTYLEKNHGMHSVADMKHRLIWEKVDRCIMLEDDCIPALSFFRYCAELLERYKDDPRIEMICGMNHLGVCEDVQADYFFAREESSWGGAYWRRSVQRWDRDFEWAKDARTRRVLWKLVGRNNSLKDRMKAHAKGAFYKGMPPNREFFMEFSVYAQHALYIIPKKNMICCEGAVSSAAHGDSIDMLPKGIRRIFNMKTYEMDFPMKHPECVFPDVEYEKKRNRIMAKNHPLLMAYRKMERAFISIRRGRMKYVVGKIKENFARTDEK